ncbi:MAG: SsrA-binding protein SmpB [Sporomusaceae bacterium]|nr:SsrA-binding protein SmpB [Sporomusaceae bacterium]
MEAKTGIKIVAENRKARHDYFIHESYEAGIALTGTEVKSLRAGKANLKDGFARIENAEVMLHNVHISPFEQGNRYNHEPLRTRKLLLHKREIMKLIGQTQTKGYTLVPLKIYFARGKAKLQLGLASGKKNYDKRQDLAAREAKRDVDRALKDRQRD